MKAKILFGAGMAAGYVLGSRSGRAAYEQLKSQAVAFWESKPVREKVAAATEAVKEKAPELPGQLTEAARRAGTVIGSATHRGGAGDGGAGDGGAGDDGLRQEAAVRARPDVGSDPALNVRSGEDWSGEGGATPGGPATNVDPGRG